MAAALNGSPSGDIDSQSTGGSADAFTARANDQNRRGEGGYHDESGRITRCPFALDPTPDRTAPRRSQTLNRSTNIADGRTE